MSENIEVTAAEIARLAGVGRAAVSNWRRRHDDFPRPTGGTDTSPSFKLADIESWLRDQGKLVEIPLKERVWRQLNAWRGDHEMSSVLAAVGVFLHYLRAADREVLGNRTDEELASQLLPMISQALPALAKFLPSSLEPQHIPLLRAMAELAEADGAERTSEQLNDRFSDGHGRQLGATPTQLAELMADLLHDPVTSVLDPACGTGTLLAAAVRAKSATHARGQEIDPSLSALAVIRLSFGAAEVDVQVGDSLRADRFTGVVADAVVCNPPFNERNWGHEDLAFDSRWEYGLPPKGESELAWVQHCLAHVRPGGPVVILMPPAVSSRRSGKKVRDLLVRRGALRSVIALPPGTAPPYGIPLSIWVLRRPDEPSEHDGVLFVDVAEEKADLVALRKLVVPLVRSFERAEHEEGRDFARLVATVDLLDDEVDLTPARHVRSSESPRDAIDVSATRDLLVKSLTDLTELMPVVKSANVTGSHSAMTSIAELVKSGAVLDRHHVDRDRGVHGAAVLRATDVIAGTGPSGAVGADGEGGAWIRLAPGDVVVAALERRVVTRVVADSDALLGAGLHLLRPDGELIDPWFLAGFVRSTAGKWMSGSLVQRLDIRRVEVPRLTITEQRRYGAAFRGLHEFGTAMRRTAVLGEDLVQAMADGLATGALRPDDSPNG